MVGQSVSHYKIVEHLGSGGMGEVYKAKDTRLGRHVALKFLPEQYTRNRQTLERFRREARAASALDHPNICAIYDIGEHEGQPFIVMQYLEGQTLKHSLQNGPLPTERLLEFGLQIGNALEAAHSRGILHRDIKPDNVFLTNSGQIKLLDFGLAKLLDSEAAMDQTSPGRLTEVGMAVGTPYYMSPDQLLDKVLDGRSDLFSLGVLLYEMATGTLPFKGSDMSALFHEILNKAPALATQINPDLPKGLGHVLNKALEKDREKRHQSAKDLVADLRRFKGNGYSASMPSAAAAGEKAPPSIAVLPFVNMSADPDNEYFSDGLAEELINALTQIKALQVASRTSAFGFKGLNQSISNIGRQLNVDTILEGSVRKAGQRLRITAQLISVEDGYHIWSERYDREMEDIFDLQDEITRKIVDKLKVNLVQRDSQPLVKRYTENVDAYNLYLKGRYHLNQRTEQSVLKAIDCLERATAEDENYALPHAGLAEAHILLNIDCPRLLCDRDPKEMVSRARQSAQKAIEVDDSCAEAHVALALVCYRLDWDWAGAEREFRLALERNDGLASAHHQYAMFLAAVNRLDDALVEIRKAHELDPLSPIISTAVGRILHFARRFDEAIAQCQRTFELHPRFPGAHFDMGLTYLAKGMFPEARKSFEKLGEISGNPKRGLMELAWVHSCQGQRDEAFELLDQLRELSNEKLPCIPLALVHAGLGDKEKAFEFLEEGYTQRDSNLLYLKCEPLFDPLRGDPRFQDLLKRLNLGS